VGEVQGGFATSSEPLVAEKEFLRRNAARIDQEMFLLRFANWRMSLLGLAALVWTIAALYRYLAPTASSLLWAELDTAILLVIGAMCLLYERRRPAEVEAGTQRRWLHAWTLLSTSAGAITGALPWFLPAGRIELQLSASIIASIIVFVFVATRAKRQLIYGTVSAYAVTLCLTLALHGRLWWAVPLCLAYTAVVTGVVLALNRSMQAAIGGELYAQYLHGELRRSHARQMQVHQREVALNERQRMLADLNDGLGAQMQAALRRLEGGRIDALGAAAALRECVDDLQLTVDAHEPAARNLNTLLGMLRHRLQPRLQAAGMRLEWRAFDLPPGATLAAPQSLDLLRILLQAVDNALQHSGGREVVVSTHRLPRQFEISVEDDGRGFDPAAALREGRGIASMQRRAARLGAELLIEPREDGGSVLRLRLKLPLGGRGQAAEGAAQP
jgi:signal transduction histidine kinase